MVRYADRCVRFPCAVFLYVYLLVEQTLKMLASLNRHADSPRDQDLFLFPEEQV
jgi:hypothetical protein